MSNWRIVDVDHFMHGNTFFNKLVSELDWFNDVQSHLTPVDKRMIHVKDIDQKNQAIDDMNVYRNYINLKEPRSNRGLERFKTKEEIDEEKKIA